MDDVIDLLQVKIEKAKVALPTETVNAIATVDWKAAILGLRRKHGYSFEQLGDLELETELLLCGLLTPEDYPKELENRMNIGKAAANELVNEMNDLVFKKIREELIKNVERKKIFAKKETSEESKGQSLKNSPRTVLEKKENLPVVALPTVPRTQMMQAEKLELKEAHPILAQKLSNSFKLPMTETEHSLNNISKNSGIPIKPNIDPYREIPE